MALHSAHRERGYSAWSPFLLMSQPYSWWNAQKQYTLTMSGTTVTTWKNIGKQAADATGGSALTLNPTGINGRQSLTGASGKYYLTSGLNSALGNTATTYIGLVQPGALAAATGYSLLNGQTADGGQGFIYGNAIGNIECGKENIAGIGAGTTSSAVGVPTLIYWNYANPAWSIYRDGVLDASGSNAVTLVNTGVTLFRSNPGATAYFIGECAELFIFDYVLTSRDRERIEGYMMHSYGIAYILPRTHPYRYDPPPASQAEIEHFMDVRRFGNWRCEEALAEALELHAPARQLIVPGYRMAA